MHKKFLATFLLIGSVIVSVNVGILVVHSQAKPPDQTERLRKAERLRETETNFFEQKQILKENIRQGWKPDQVLSIIGPPDQIRTVKEGTSAVTLWQYRGSEVIIQFKSGSVWKWFFRFMN